MDYSTFGELLNVSETKPKFRYTGKMFDDVTGLQWNISRWYDACVEKWCSEDPAGFEAEDSNLSRYVINCPTKYLDYFGIWKLQEGSQTIYIAQEGDTFETLVRTVGNLANIQFGDESKNKSCIRPVVDALDQKTINAMKQSWNKQLPACGGKYDAISLIRSLPSTTITPSGVYSIGYDTNGYIQNAGTFYGATHFQTEILLAHQIRTLSQGGLQPIRRLTLIGHGHQSVRRIGSQSRDNPQFGFADLGDLTLNGVTITPKLPWQWVSWDWAISSNKTLPYGCWFSFDAQIRLVGCDTSSMAQLAASVFVRSGGTAWGTKFRTIYRIVNGQIQMGWVKNTIEDDFVTTPDDYNSSGNWISSNGKN